MPGDRSGLFAFGRFLLDLRRHRVLHDGLDVHLPSRAIFVLAVLARAPRRVLTKSAIAAGGWPDGHASHANLMVQISKLRSVLRADGDRDGWIRTVRGKGYVFDVDVRELDPPGADGDSRQNFDLRLSDGIALLQGFDSQSVRRARRRFEDLHEERPGHPSVTLHLALTLIREWYLGQVSGTEILDRLPQLVEEGRRLAPGHALTHLVEGVTAYSLHRDFEAGDAALYHSLRLQPHDATAHEYLAYSLMARRRFSAALRHLDRARLLSPSNLDLATYVGTAHYLARRYREALDAFDRVIELHPGHVFAHCWRAVAAALLPDREEACRSAAVVREAVGDAPLTHSIFGAVHAILGDRAEAERSVQWLERRRAEGAAVSPLLFAVVWTHTGEKRQAVNALRESMADPFPGLCLVAAEPVWDPLRSEGDFHDLLASLGLARYAQARPETTG